MAGYEILGDGDEYVMGEDGLIYVQGAADRVMYDEHGNPHVMSGADSLDQLLALSGAVPYGRGMMRPQGQAANRLAVQSALRQRLAAMRAPMGIAASPMASALAARVAQSGSVVQQRDFSRSREWPMGLDSGATAILPGASARVTARPQVQFRVDRIVVPSDIAGLFVIDDIKVGKNSQFVAEGAIPARTFQENGVGISLHGDTAQVSMDVVVAVTNISGAAARFRATIIGPAVE